MEKRCEIKVDRFESIDDLSKHLESNLKALERPTEIEVKTSNRAKTRLLNFGVFRAVTRNTETEIDYENPSVDRETIASLVVVDGPGQGKGFYLYDNKTEIGRGEDQDVQLGFGDEFISRQGHATILYNPQFSVFELSDGGKVNPVLLNGKQVIVSEPLRSGDLLGVGTTILRFTEK